MSYLFEKLDLDTVFGQIVVGMVLGVGVIGFLFRNFPGVFDARKDESDVILGGNWYFILA